MGGERKVGFEGGREDADYDQGKGLVVLLFLCVRQVGPQPLHSSEARQKDPSHVTPLLGLRTPATPVATVLDDLGARTKKSNLSQSGCPETNRLMPSPTIHRRLRAVEGRMFFNRS